MFQRLLLAESVSKRDLDKRAGRAVGRARQKRRTGPTLSSNCCVIGPDRTTRQPPIPTVPHAHEPTSGSIRIGSHFASARIANLEPTNCFSPAPKPNEKRKKVSCAAASRVAPTPPVRKLRRPFTSGTTNSRVKSMWNWFNVTSPSDGPRDSSGGPKRSVDVDLVHRNSTREKSSNRTPADKP